MIKIDFNLLQILTMNSLKVKHQGKSFNQLVFHLSAYTHLWKRAVFQLHTKYKLTVWKIQSLVLMMKMIWKRRLGCTRQCKKNSKQHRFQKKSEFFPWYQISGLECTVQNILNTFKKIKKVGGILAKSASKKRKTTTTETLHLVTNVYEYDNFSR